MITISKIVNDLIKEEPFLEVSISKGIVNLSSLARIFKPKIEEELLRDVKEGAIVMALKRYSKKMNKNLNNIQTILKRIKDITVRSNLTEFTFLNSDKLFDRQKELLNRIKEQDIFLIFNKGLFQTTIVISSNFEKAIEEIFAKEKLISKFTDLSAITLKLPKENVETSGIYYAILKLLAWKNINVVEIASTFTELTTVHDNKDIDKAFSALKKISSA